MAATTGAAAGGDVDPQRVQWSHVWLGAGTGLVGVCPTIAPASSPLWQMTEKGSTAAAAPRVVIPPHKAVCSAIAAIAAVLRTRLKPVRMLSSDRGAIYQTIDGESSGKFAKKCHGPCIFAADPLSL
jgi:hypothetical protein